MNKKSDEDDNRKWNDITSEEKLNIYSVYTRHGSFFTGVTRSMSDLIFSWLFILNSGGLIAVITIYSSAVATQK